MNVEGGIDGVYDSEEKLVKFIGEDNWNNKEEYKGYGNGPWEDSVFELTNTLGTVFIGKLNRGKQK